MAEVQARICATCSLVSGVLLAISALSATSAGAQTQQPNIDAADWEPLMSGKQYEYSIRKSDLLRAYQSEKRIIWVLVRPVAGNTAYMLRYDVNCGDRTLVSDYRTFFGDDGNPHDGYNTPWLKRGVAVPNSLDERITDATCP